MIERGTKVLINNDEFKNLEGEIIAPTLKIVYAIEPKEGKIILVEEKDITIIK